MLHISFIFRLFVTLILSMFTSLICHFGKSLIVIVCLFTTFALNANIATTCNNTTLSANFNSNSNCSFITINRALELNNQVAEVKLNAGHYNLHSNQAIKTTITKRNLIVFLGHNYKFSSISESNFLIPTLNSLSNFKALFNPKNSEQNSILVPLNSNFDRTKTQFQPLCPTILTPLPEHFNRSLCSS